jgi:cell wall-associated NlpC family hydrolase
MSGILTAKSLYQPLDLRIKSSYKMDKNITFALHQRGKFISSIAPVTDRIIRFNSILRDLGREGKSTPNINKSDTNTINHLLQEAKGHLGKRYVWGAIGPWRFDCSGFTSYVCRKSGIHIPRTSIKQGRVGKKVSRSQLKKGDLVFFDTSRGRRGYINHVGIYIGGQKFIHASSAKRRVVISSLNKRFYKARFKWGRRVK